MNLKSLGAVLVMAWVASSCGEELRTPGVEVAPVDPHATRQGARSTNKVLILDSTLKGGPTGREVQAVKASLPAAQIDVVKPAQWRAMTAEQFMSYRAIILSDAGCKSGTAAYEAAVDTRHRWGAIVDGNVVILSTDPTHNETEQLVENAIQFVLASAHRTGMYISLGCSYRGAPANTPVPLLEPFGDFKVQGVPDCASSGHLFQMSPPTLSENLSDAQLPGEGCAARSVFTSYPEHTFAFAAIATSSSEAPIPGQRTFTDYMVEPEAETSFVGTPYIVVRGALALSAGCGTPDHTPPAEQCELGDGLNGRPAGQGEAPEATCSFSCHLNWCGDGFVDVALGEECDNGVNNGRTRDSSGNIGACSSFCKIPNRPPLAICKNVTVAATVTCGVPADINDGSSDPDGDLVGCTQSPSGAYPIGNTQVTLTCTDQMGQSASCTGMVTVRDEVRPTVSLRGPASEALECLRGATYSDQGATASDACEGPVPVTTSGSVNLELPGSYQVTYTAKDSSEHVETASRTVIVSDTQPPQIVCPEPIVVEALAGALVSVTPGVATATDTCSLARVSSTAQTRFPAGITPVLYTATDAAGNTATCTSTVTVLEVRPPDSTGGPVSPETPSPELMDRALMGGGSSCSSTGSGPSSLALMGLGVLAALLLRKRARPSPLLLLAGLLLGTTASAQPEGVPTFELELLKLNPSGKGSLLMGTGELLSDGDYRLSLTTHYQKDPLVLFQNGRQVGVVVRHRTTAHLAVAYGLWGRLEFGAQVPVVLFQRGDDLTARGVGGLEGGVAPGTPLFNVQVMLLAQQEEDLVDLALGVQAGPPLGSAAALAREARATPSLMVGHTFSSLRAAIDAGMLLRPRTILTPDEKIQDELGHALRLGGMISSLGEGLRGELAVNTLVPLKRQGFSVETLTGARWPVGDSLEAYGMAGLGFGSAPGTPDFRVLFGMAYGRARPARVELASYDPGPTPKDSDGDHLFDEVDRCPTVPGLPGFQGCPDQDGDSVEDEVDLCPAEPGRVDLRGCSEQDTDGDGVLDESDVCPAEAGLPEKRGCPFVDKDEDTVDDQRDNCPDMAGPADNQGCPAEEEQLVIIETDRIAIKDKVHFDFDRATIQPRSFQLLDQVARVLIEHPEIISVSIEGHTDGQGPAEYNRKLSQRRSEAVREYLTRKGVAPERMEARGVGEDAPVASNATSAGRAANRRVEFITRYADSQK